MIVNAKEYLLEFIEKLDGRIAIHGRKVKILDDDSTPGFNPAIHFPKCQDRFVQVHQQEPRKDKFKGVASNLFQGTQVSLNKCTLPVAFAHQRAEPFPAQFNPRRLSLRSCPSVPRVRPSTA